MFESIISNLLIRYLGEYIENIDSKSLSIAVFKGNLDLYDLKLKKTAFEGFNLPVTVVQGILGHLRLSIPWTSLDSSPVIAELSDLYLAVKPKKDLNMSSDELDKIELEGKLKQLRIYETMRKFSNSNVTKKNTMDQKKEGKKESGFVAKLTEKIINNLQVRVHNIHGRYEDLSDPKNKILLGFTLKDFVIETCNENWKKTFLTSTPVFTYKIAEVKALSIYMNSEDSNIFSSIMSPSAFREQMKSSIDNHNSRQFLINPIDGILKVTIHNSEVVDTKYPKCKLDFEFDNIILTLNSCQYQNFMRMTEYFSKYSTTAQFSRLHPKCSITTKEEINKWWNYAVSAAKQSVYSQYCTWDQIEKRNKDRELYVRLYKKQRGVEWHEKLAPSESDKLKTLEKLLSLSDIILYREFAEQQLKEEERNYQQIVAERKLKNPSQVKSSSSSSSSSWFSWGTKSSDVDEYVPYFTLTDEDKERLYKSLGYVEQESKPIPKLPRDYIQLNVSFLLKKGSIILEDSETNTSIVQLEFKDFQAYIFKFPEALKIHLGLGLFEIFDKCTPNSSFSKILYKKNTVYIPGSKLAAIDIESNPESGKCDYFLNMFLDEVCFVVNPKLFQKIFAFFSLPNDVNLSSLRVAAKKKVSNLQQQAATMLKIALENKKVIGIDLFIRNPNIIFPEQLTDSKAQIVVMSLGNLAVQTDVNKAEREKRLKTQEFISDDYYEKYRFNITDFHLQSTDIEGMKNGKSDQIVGKTSFSLSLDYCITPSNQNLSQLKIKASIPSIHLKVSKEKLSLLWNILNQLYDVTQDLTGKAKLNSTIETDVEIHGPIALTRIERQSCFMQLWQSQRKIVIYQDKKSTYPIAAIHLDENVVMTDDKQFSENALSITLPQNNNRKDIQFQLKFQDGKSKEQWKEAITQLVLYQKQKSDVKETDLSLEIPLEDELEEKSHKSATQNIVDLNFSLGEISAVMHKESLDISRITLKRLKLDFLLRNYDKKLVTSLDTFEVIDLINASKEEKFVLEPGTKSTKDELVIVKIIQASPMSPYIASDEEDQSTRDVLKKGTTIMNVKFDGVKLYFEPLIFSYFIEFGFGMVHVSQRYSDRYAQNFYALKKSKENAEKNSYFFLTATMNQMHVDLVDKSHCPFMTLSMNNAKLETVLSSCEIIVSGCLGNFVAIDADVKTKHKEILGLNNKETSLINFTYCHNLNQRKSENSSGSSGQIPHFSSSLKAVLYSVRLVFLMKIADHLKVYFLKGPLMDAFQKGSSGMKKSTEKTGNISSNSLPKLDVLHLDIELINPLLYVPASSETSRSIVGDLGKIHIKNEILQDDLGNWIDNYVVMLRSMNLESNIDGVKRKAVKNVDVKVGIRNTIQNISQNIPSMEIQFIWTPVVITLSKFQYDLLFEIYQHNFMNYGDQYEKKQEEEEGAIDFANYLSTKMSEMDTPKKEIQQELKKTDDGQSANQLSIDRKILFNVPEISLNIQENSEDCIANFKAWGLTVSYHQKLNMTYGVRFQLEGIHVFDKRQATGSAFQQIVSLEKSEKAQNFIIFSFDKTSTTDSSINLYTSSPEVVLVPEFVMSVKKFFYPPQFMLEKKESKQELQYNLKKPSQTLEFDKEAENNSEVSKNKNSLMLNAVLGKPRFLFPENSSNKNSNVLVLEFKCIANYTYNSIEERGVFGFEKAIIYVDASGQTTPYIPIMEPVTFNVELNSKMTRSATLSSKLNNFIITVDNDLKCRLVYADLKTILNVIKNFTSNMDEKKEELQKSPNEFKLLSPIESKKQQSTIPGDMNSTTTSMDNENDNQHSNLEREKIGKRKETDILLQEYSVRFSTKHVFSVLLVDDIRGYDIPLVNCHLDKLYLQLGASSGESTNIQMQFQFDCTVNYFNAILSEWEPVIEPWKIISVYKRDAIESHQGCYKNSILITCPEHYVKPLDINISKEMIQTVITTSNLWTKGFSDNLSSSMKYDPLVMRNYSGFNLSFWKPREKKYQELPSGKTHGFHLPHMHDIDYESVKKQMEITIDLFHLGIFRVNARKVGVKSHILKSVTLIAEVEQIEGRKIITIRSNFKLRNITSMRMEVGIRSGIEGSQITSIGILEPENDIGIPVIEFDKNYLSVRPLHDNDGHSDYEWSPASSGFSFSAIMSNQASNKLYHCRRSSHGAEFKKLPRIFNCVLHIKRDYLKIANDANQTFTKDFSLCIRPPLAIENLLGSPIEITLFERDDPTVAKQQFSIKTLDRGEKMHIYEANLRNTILMKVLLTDIDGCWNTKEVATLNNNAKETKQLSNHVTLVDNEENPLVISLEYRFQTGTAHREVTLFCPYWIFNSTGISHMSIKKQDIPIAGLDVLRSNISDPKPLMLSFPFNTMPKDHKISISVNGSEYSREFSISTPGVTGEIDLFNDKQCFNIGLYVALAPGKFKRTKVILFSSRYILVNKTNLRVLVKQSKTINIILLDPGNKNNFYWSEEGEHLISVCMPDHEWSSPFKLNNLGDVKVKLTPQDDKNLPFALTVTITHERGTSYVIITKPEKPPYMIHNQLNCDIEICQVDENKWWPVKFQQKYPYLWDNNNGSQLLKIRVDGATSPPININMVTEKQIRIDVPSAQRDVYMDIEADGPARHIYLSELVEERTNEKEIALLELIGIVPSLGISLINGVPSEIAYVTVNNLSFKYLQSNQHRSVEVVIGDIQLDSQIYDAPYPVVLYRAGKGSDLPFLHIAICQVEPNGAKNNAIAIFPYFSINMQEANVSIDYAFLYNIGSFVESLMESPALKNISTTDVNDITSVISEPDNTVKADHLYFNRLELHPIKLNLTFKFNTVQKVEEISPDNSLILLLKSIGFTVANVDDAPIRLNALLLSHLSTSKDGLKSKVKKHYLRALTNEIYKIIGSLDIIGNPVGLFNDLSTGVKDFFYEPASSITKSPEEFTQGVLKGTSSLFTKSVHGTFNTASRVSSALGKSLRLLTFDDQYINESEKKSQSKARDFTEGVRDGGEALMKGFFRGASDLITKPIEGVKEDGAYGFVKNLSVALVGVPTKPLAGIVEFAQKTTEGISNTGVEQVKPSRLPREFGKDGVLVPYSKFDAFRSYLFNQLVSLKVINPTEKPLYHCEIDKSHVCLLTESSIMIVNIYNFSVEWKCELCKLDSIRRDEESNIILISKPQQSTFFFVRQLPSVTQKKISPQLINQEIADIFYEKLMIAWEKNNHLSNQARNTTKTTTTTTKNSI